MTFRLYLRQAMELPIHVAVKKAIRKFIKEIGFLRLRRLDFRRSTFAKTVSWRTGKLQGYFVPKPINLLLSVYIQIMEVTENYIAHRFDLFYSGWISIGYGMTCQGVQGHRYETGFTDKPDREGYWLESIINSANLPESKRVWQIIYSSNSSDFKTNAYSPIDWQLDFKSGYRWFENTWYRDINFEPDQGVDIKVPWELGRMQHLIQLALVWVVGKYGILESISNAQNKIEPISKNTDEKEHYDTPSEFNEPDSYVSEFRSQVLDFIATNPPRWGVNWACTMDVGIRVANWLVAYDIFRANGAKFDVDFIKEFIRSVYDHGLHIINNLEYSEDLTSNHYLSNIAGLLFVAVYLPQSVEIDEWRKFAVQELINEMEKQIYSDGTDFEASTCYHRLVLELFFYTSLLMVRRDDHFTGENYKDLCENIFGREYTGKLYKMFDALCYLLKPNGKMPQIGDNDSGQFFKSYSREVLDMRYLLAMGAVFFKESRWKIMEFFQSGEDIAEIGIMLGTKGLKVWESLPGRALNDITSRHFSESGWYLMRDNSNYCLISCGPNGQNGFGGHCHNDKLSFELNLNGEDILIDSGTYLYTPDPGKRNLFRSTAYHNTVVIDKEEQNRFDDGYLFSLRDDSMARCLLWESEKTHDLFIGEHSGYARLKEPVIHRREILLDKKSQTLRIKDRFKGQGKHLFEWYFHFAPEIQVKLSKDKSVDVKSKSGLEMVLSPVMHCSVLHFEVFEGWTSSAYGVKEKAAVCRYRIEREVNFETVFEFRRFR